MASGAARRLLVFGQPLCLGSRVDGVFWAASMQALFHDLCAANFYAFGCLRLRGQRAPIETFYEYRACVCETLAPAPKRTRCGTAILQAVEETSTRPGSCWGLGHRASAHSCTLGFGASERRP